MSPQASDYRAAYGRQISAGTGPRWRAVGCVLHTTGEAKLRTYLRSQAQLGNERKISGLFHRAFVFEELVVDAVGEGLP